MPPKAKPQTTGIGARFFSSVSAFSKEGINKEKIDADNMIPEAKPIVRVFMNFDVLLKKKTKDAPKTVIRKGNVKLKMIDKA